MIFHTVVIMLVTLLFQKQSILTISLNSVLFTIEYFYLKKRFINFYYKSARSSANNNNASTFILLRKKLRQNLKQGANISEY